MAETMDPETLKSYLTSAPISVEPLSMGHMGALIGHLEEVCGGDEQRHAFLAYIYGVDSSRQLTVEQWSRLKEWLDPRPIEEPVGPSGKQRWAVRAECYDEAKAAVSASYLARRQAQIDAGQMDLWGGAL